LTIPSLISPLDFPGPVLGIDTSSSAAAGVLRPDSEALGECASVLTTAKLSRVGERGGVGGTDNPEGARRVDASDGIGGVSDGGDTGGRVGTDRPPGLASLGTDPRGQVEELGPLILGLLADAGLTPADLAAIAVGTGPAPYTGLRIGLATARALGLALGIPVWGVSSLDALAADAAAHLSLPPGTRILATGDAKRREIYWSAYQTADAGALLRESGPAVGPALDAPRAAVVVGGGASAYPDVLPPTPDAPQRVNPLVLARIAVLRAAAGHDQPAAPLYLRRPDVAPPAPRKRVLGRPAGPSPASLASAPEQAQSADSVGLGGE
jgi:tRNA threonylcarbamoyladenosine biosynthesis protein TsaB